MLPLHDVVTSLPRHCKELDRCVSVRKIQERPRCVIGCVKLKKKLWYEANTCITEIFAK